MFQKAILHMLSPYSTRVKMELSIDVMGHRKLELLLRLRNEFLFKLPKSKEYPLYM